jgi:hypothetical protein
MTNASIIPVYKQQLNETLSLRELIRVLNAERVT